MSGGFRIVSDTRVLIKTGSYSPKDYSILQMLTNKQ